MKRLAFAVLFAACASAPQAYVTDKEPQLGTVFPIQQASSEYWLVDAGQMSPAYRVTFERVQYIVAVDPMRRVRYVETTDPQFRTREGLSVGASDAEVFAAGGSRAIDDPGWGRYSRLQSGWNARYGAGADAQTVISFFKRQ